MVLGSPWAMAQSGLPVFDLANYGANPSATDNTEAVQAAINDAQRAGGGIVFFSAPGTYSFAGTLLLPAFVTLLGQGTVARGDRSRAAG